MSNQNSETSKTQTSMFKGSFFYSKAHLVLADGTEFACQAFGRTELCVVGEVVFHTGMSGYQEILTDPSYYGQIITFTYPHIGNYGVNKQDYESAKIHASGVIMRDYVPDYSNHRAHQSLDNWLNKQGVMGLSGLDTRKLTRHIREHGSMPAAFGTGPLEDLAEAARKATGTNGKDLVKNVTTNKVYSSGRAGKTIVAYDFGIKKSIIKYLELIGKVVVVPADTTAKEVMKHQPDGVFLSNGPGDPAAVNYAAEEIEQLLGNVPIFGICLGHQLLCMAVGAKTHKLQFGHHGANHPVMDKQSGQVEITSQNHNYAVVGKTLRGAKVSHVNLNDGVVEGIKIDDKYAFSVQYHPEAGPGPHDSLYLFEQFKELMDSYAEKN